MARESVHPRKRGLAWLGPLLGVAMLGLALFILYHALRRYDLAEVVRNLHAIPAPRVGMALACVALSYLFQTGYDFLALLSLHRRASALRAALAAFVSNAFTNNIGFSLLTSTSLRYRFYSAWGYRPLEIAQVIALSKLSFLTGLLSCAGILQLAAPAAWPPGLEPRLSMRWVGALLLLPGAILLVANLLHPGKPLRLGKYRLCRPASSILILQAATASLSFVFSALTLLFLLPGSAFAQAQGNLGTTQFISTFLAAKVASLVLPVPGSLGVLEGAMLALFSPYLADYPLLGGLLAYRLLFYLAPFGAAVILLAAFEGAARLGRGRGNAASPA